MSRGHPPHQETSITSPPGSPQIKTHSSAPPFYLSPWLLASLAPICLMPLCSHREFHVTHGAEPFTTQVRWPNSAVLMQQSRSRPIRSFYSWCSCKKEEKNFPIHCPSPPEMLSCEQNRALLTFISSCLARPLAHSKHSVFAELIPK